MLVVYSVPVVGAGKWQLAVVRIASLLLTGLLTQSLMDAPLFYVALLASYRDVH